MRALHAGIALGTFSIIYGAHLFFYWFINVGVGIGTLLEQHVPNNVTGLRTHGAGGLDSDIKACSLKLHAMAAGLNSGVGCLSLCWHHYLYHRISPSTGKKQ